MNYQRIYDEFIADRTTKQNFDGYGEKHHIVPRSLGGSNKKSNLIRLTPGDHYFAHTLLVKIYPSSKEMGRAFWLISHTRIGVKMTRTQYARAKTAWNNSMSGDNNPNTDKSNYNWINSITGETFFGTRSELCEHTDNADEIGNYFCDSNTTRSGWFDTTRFSSLSDYTAWQKNKGWARRVDVVCLNTMEVFDSVTAASAAKNVPRPNLSKCLNGDRQEAGGMQWAYASDVERIAKGVAPLKPNHNAIQVINIDTGAIFSNATLAAISIGQSSNSNLIAACKGRKRTVGGFRWAYVKQEAA